jgi:hypothetical protein
MCPEEKQLQRADFARWSSEFTHADKNARHKVYRHNRYKLESQAHLLREYLWALKSLRRNADVGSSFFDGGIYLWRGLGLIKTLCSRTARCPIVGRKTDSPEVLIVAAKFNSYLI